MCRDNICRLWAQSNDENNNHKFFMCKMIEPFCLPPSLNHTTVNEQKISYVHWIDNREIHRAVYSNNIIEKRKFQKKWNQKNNENNEDINNNKYQKELKDILKENQDMIFHVSPDGTVVIWGVQVSVLSYILYIYNFKIFICINYCISVYKYIFLSHILIYNYNLFLYFIKSLNRILIPIH